MKNKTEYKKPTHLWTPEELINELKRVSQLSKSGSVTKHDMITHGNVSPAVYQKKFKSWNNALTIAKLPIKKRMNIPDHEIFDEIERVWQLLGKQPTGMDFYRSSKLFTVAKTRFGGGFQGAIKAYIQSRGIGIKTEKKSDSVVRPANFGKEFGAQINFEGMIYAPMNENGVILLFGMLAERLGYQVKGIRQSDFPDCYAMFRDPKKSTNRECEIEFEHKSSHFVLHKHPITWMGTIVCWEHDWREVPHNIAVIELKAYIRNFEKQL